MVLKSGHKKITQSAQIAQSAALQHEENVYKNYIPLFAVFIGIVGVGFYMSRCYYVGEQAEGKPKMKQCTTAKPRSRPI